METSDLDRHGFSQQALQASGFEGFITASMLREDRLVPIPKQPGIYVVLRPLIATPTFTTTSVGGWFKGKDPTVAIQILKAKWVPGAELIYVGKATGGAGTASGLRRRLALLLRYGAGEAVGHQGGRYLWQVKGIDDYRYAWRVAADPTADENALLTGFLAAYGAYPFANIAGPRG